MADDYAQSIRIALRGLDATLEDLARATGIPVDRIEQYAGGVEVPAMVEQRAISQALLDPHAMKGSRTPTVFIYSPDGPWQLDVEKMTFTDAGLLVARGTIDTGRTREFLLPPSIPYYIKGEDLFERGGFGQ